MEDDPDCGGYDYDWVNFDLKTDFTCLICQLVAKQAQQTKCCGYLFCKTCIATWQESGAVCPVCRKNDSAYPLQIYEDKQSIRRVNSLAVYCTNKEKGCKWEGELRNLVNHSKQCPKQLVHCPNQCGAQLERGILPNHLKHECDFRVVRCKHCNCEMKHKEFRSNHLSVCPKVLIRCSNSYCGEKLIREKLSDHLENHCEYRLVKCFNNCGADAIRFFRYSYHLKNTCPHRIVQCAYCKFQGQYKIVAGKHHDVDCQEVLVDCLNKGKGCQEEIKRANRVDHLDVCPKQSVKCKYIGICSETMMREEESNHYKLCTDEHLSSAWLKLQNVEENAAALISSKLSHLEQALIEIMSQSTNSIANKFAIESKEKDKIINHLEEKSEQAFETIAKLKSKIEKLEFESILLARESNEKLNILEHRLQVKLQSADRETLEKFNSFKERLEAISLQDGKTNAELNSQKMLTSAVVVAIVVFFFFLVKLYARSV